MWTYVTLTVYGRNGICQNADEEDKERRTLKKLFATLLCGMVLFSLASCGTGDKTSKETAQPSPETTLGVENLSVETPYQPVSSYKGYFVVRDESNSMYGVIDETGESVLPCEYGEIRFDEAESQTVLKVKSKGSYGVYDLQGQELIPCEYTEIEFTPYADLCIVETFTGQNDILNFRGESILPESYDIVEFAYGNVVAGKSATETEEGSIAVYQPDGTQIKNFTLEEESMLDFMVGNGGNTIAVNYLVNGMGLLDFNHCLVVEGEEAIWSNTLSVNNYLFFFTGDSLVAKNVETQKETAVWSFPEEQVWSLFAIQKLSEHTDPVTGVKFIDVYVSGVGDISEVKYYLRIVLDKDVSVIDYVKAGINEQIVGGDKLGQFYNGVAMVLPAEGYLYTIGIDGNKIAELSNPYTDRDRSFLLGNAAVLNNNGYYTIVDAQGETILSDEGYSNIGALNVNGLYVITDQNGKVGLIDQYAEEIVPCGGIESVETGVERASSESWELESSNAAEDELYILHNGDMWAVYSALETKLITQFQKMDGEAATQYNCFLGNGGYPLIDEDGESVYLISHSSGTYQITSVNKQ